MKPRNVSINKTRAMARSIHMLVWKGDIFYGKTNDYREKENQSLRDESIYCLPNTDWSALKQYVHKQ